jgi:porin
MGVLELYMDADMKKLGLWDGLCFHANGFQIHGNSITGANIGGLMPVTSLEALPATRLFELWLEQFLFNDTVSIKVGQLAADEEFFAADGGGFFINGTWGWAPIAAENNPGGGPAYPLATPGVRVAVTPTENTNVMVGVYNGDPSPACAADDPQICNPHGLEFELDDDPLLMIEGAYNYNLAGGRLPGTIKIGGWNHFGDFEDNRVDVGGDLVVVTGNSGKPLDNDHALYIILDQLLWRVPGSEDAQGVGMFLRFAGAPDDRNLVDFYFDGGLTFTGMIPGRPNDALAIGYAYTGISNDVTANDITLREPGPRREEQLIEIAYTMEIMNGWTLQPDFQYIMNPSGDPGQDDATVIGARNTFTF